MYLLVEFHREGSAINGATPSSFGEIQHRFACLLVFPNSLPPPSFPRERRLVTGEPCPQGQPSHSSHPEASVLRGEPQSTNASVENLQTLLSEDFLKPILALVYWNCNSYNGAAWCFQSSVLKIPKRRETKSKKLK